MVQFVYVDETGSSGRGAAQQAHLTLAAVLVPEDKVQLLAAQLQRVAFEHLVEMPQDFEFKGHQLWHGGGPWESTAPGGLITAYEAALNILVKLDLGIAYATINKPALRARYGESADRNAYRLTLQFLLEKVDSLSEGLSIVIADETKQEELAAVKMVSDLQVSGMGEVPGRRLRTVINSLHFVRSWSSPGVQMADLVAYVIQRSRRSAEAHPDALEGLRRLRQLVNSQTRTYRNVWP